MASLGFHPPDNLAGLDKSLDNEPKRHHNPQTQTAQMGLRVRERRQMGLSRGPTEAKPLATAPLRRPQPPSPQNREPKLLDQLREELPGHKNTNT